jgi:hypothetical protein
MHDKYLTTLKHDFAALKKSDPEAYEQWEIVLKHFAVSVTRSRKAAHKRLTK